MLRFLSSLCLAGLTAGALLGCKKECVMPQPDCYSGTVVANSCTIGILIDVDAAYSIGALATSVQGKRFLGNNVIVVANSDSFPNLGRAGQRVYFTYRSVAAQAPNRYCFVDDGVTTNIPFLALNNVSTVSCDSVGTN